MRNEIQITDERHTNEGGPYSSLQARFEEQNQDTLVFLYTMLGFTLMVLAIAFYVVI